jgi:electron transport complex protein RnfA
MGTFQHFALLLIGGALVNNILLTRFIGLCPFFGVSSSMETSLGMAGAVVFVMTLASSATWVFYNVLLVGEFLYIPAFILVIAALVQFVEMYLKKASPGLYRSLGIFLPLITTNCAVLATATEAVKPGFFKMNMAYGFGFGETLVYTVGVALGFGFALMSFAALRDRLEVAPVPAAMKGTPMAFITAGLLSLSYIGLGSWFGL